MRGNVFGQQKLRENLDDFLKDIDKSSLAIYLVNEIFKDNKKFLNIVNFMISHVYRTQARFCER